MDCPPWVDFLVWILEQSDVTVEPFVHHPKGNCSLAHLGLTAETWRTWQQRLLLRYLFGYTAWKITASQEDLQREHNRHRNNYIRHKESLVQHQPFVDDDPDSLECQMIMEQALDSLIAQEYPEDWTKKPEVMERFKWIKERFDLEAPDLLSENPLDYLQGSNDLKNEIERLSADYNYSLRLGNRTRQIHSLRQAFEFQNFLFLYTLYDHQRSSFAYELIPDLPIQQRVTLVVMHPDISKKEFEAALYALGGTVVSE